MKKMIVIFLLFFCNIVNSQIRYELPCNEKLLRKSRIILLLQVGTKERSGKNDGKKIEKYLESVGIYYPAPYCQAGQYYCFSSACRNLGYHTDSIPIPKSGAAISSMQYAKREGLRTKYIPKINDLIIWKKFGSWQGHVERIIAIGKAGWILTVGFNTTNGKLGSQREGNGVFIRKRNIFHEIGRLRIYGLVGFIEKKE